MDKSKGGHPENTNHAEPSFSEYAQAKADSNISDTQAKRWQKLAAVRRGGFFVREIYTIDVFANLGNAQPIV
ncbi:MAG: hypothetical protein GY927_20160 [bacterium]|nr:hypothetical protein [bacterium]